MEIVTVRCGQYDLNCPGFIARNLTKAIFKEAFDLEPELFIPFLLVGGVMRAAMLPVRRDLKPQEQLDRAQALHFLASDEPIFDGYSVRELMEGLRVREDRVAEGYADWVDRPEREREQREADAAELREIWAYQARITAELEAKAQAQTQVQAQVQAQASANDEGRIAA